MWNIENRARYDRSRLRYPSDLTEAEWELVAPLIPPAKRGGNKRTVDLREVVNGLMYVLSTGCQWRAIPKDLPPRSTLHDYLDVWSWDVAWLGRCRRLAKDWECLSRMALAFLKLASVRIMLRKLCNPA